MNTPLFYFPPGKGKYVKQFDFKLLKKIILKHIKSK